MITEGESVKMRKFEEVYKAHADNIYKICLYYLRDEKKANDLAVKVFLQYYTEYGVENSEETFPRMVHETIKLLIKEQEKCKAAEEQRE